MNQDTKKRLARLRYRYSVLSKRFTKRMRSKMKADSLLMTTSRQLSITRSTIAEIIEQEKRSKGESHVS
jgi:Zn-dependent oligopeptidase